MEKTTFKNYRYNLSGPLTWILLVLLLVGFISGVKIITMDTPAKVLRSYFEASFAGDYEKAWGLILKDSAMIELKGDLDTFTETWERGKNHGTEYIGVRVDGVLRDRSGSVAKVLYTIMQYDQVTKEKVPGRPDEGLYKVKILQDSFVGSMFLAKNSDGDWKMKESEY